MIFTVSNLMRELSKIPQDMFLTVTIENKEFGIKNIQRKSTNTNKDDSSIYLTLVCDK